MTAEFVIVLPAVLVVLMLAVGAILLSAQRVALTSAAAEVARQEARGDSGSAATRLAALPSGVRVSRSDQSDLHCVTLHSKPLGGILGEIGVSARGCAVRVRIRAPA